MRMEEFVQDVEWDGVNEREDRERWRAEFMRSGRVRIPDV